MHSNSIIASWRMPWMIRWSIVPTILIRSFRYSMENPNQYRIIMWLRQHCEIISWISTAMIIPRSSYMTCLRKALFWRRIRVLKRLFMSWWNLKTDRRGALTVTRIIGKKKEANGKNNLRKSAMKQRNITKAIKMETSKKVHPINVFWKRPSCFLERTVIYANIWRQWARTTEKCWRSWKNFWRIRM